MMTTETAGQFDSHVQQNRSEAVGRLSALTDDELVKSYRRHREMLRKVAEVEPNDPIFIADTEGMAFNDLFRERGVPVPDQ